MARSYFQTEAGPTLLLQFLSRLMMARIGPLSASNAGSNYRKQTRWISITVINNNLPLIIRESASSYGLIYWLGREHITCDHQLITPFSGRPQICIIGRSPDIHRGMDHHRFRISVIKSFTRPLRGHKTRCEKLITG